MSRFPPTETSSDMDVLFLRQQFLIEFKDRLSSPLYFLSYYLFLFEKKVSSETHSDATSKTTQKRKKISKISTQDLKVSSSCFGVKCMCQ